MTSTKKCKKLIGNNSAGDKWENIYTTCTSIQTLMALVNICNGAEFCQHEYLITGENILFEENGLHYYCFSICIIYILKTKTMTLHCGQVMVYSFLCNEAINFEFSLITCITM